VFSETASVHLHFTLPSAALLRPSEIFRASPATVYQFKPAWHPFGCKRSNQCTRRCALLLGTQQRGTVLTYGAAEGRLTILPFSYNETPGLRQLSAR
jgi:hypothetical protein